MTLTASKLYDWRNDLSIAAREAAHKAWAARDWRVLAPLLGFVFFALGFYLGQSTETNRALSLARERMAEWKADARKQIAAEEMGKALALLEKQWPCVAWGPSMEKLECVIREKRP